MSARPDSEPGTAAGGAARIVAPPLGALPAALAASIAIHVGALVAAATAVAWPRADDVHAPPGAAPSRSLDVVLARAAPAPATLPLPARIEASRGGASLRVAAAPASAASAPVAGDAAARPAQLAARAAGTAAGAGEPRVEVDDQVPRARFGDALDGEALAGIPTEIDVPVRLPGRLVVPYPHEALAAGREATVLAWSIVDENGTAEEPHVVDGPPEFAEAVREALRATRFVPARDGGAPVRFYVALQFDFRIEARPAVATRAATPVRR